MDELKPEDVMRALEFCNFNAECDDCPYVGRCWDLNIDALALLREKDAEIKELTDDNKWSAKRIIETDKLVSLLKAEVERLNTELKAMRGAAISLKMHYESARADAKAEAAATFLARSIAKMKERGELKPFVLVEDLYKIAKEFKEGGENDGKKGIC